MATVKKLRGPAPINILRSTAKAPKTKGATHAAKRKAATPTAKAKAKKAIPVKAKAPSKTKKAAIPKKKLGGAKVKPAAKKVAKPAGDHWFAKLSKKAQAEYIKTHPNSKYAKGSKSGAKVVAKPNAAKAKAALKAGSHPKGHTQEANDKKELSYHKKSLVKAKADHEKLRAKLSTAKLRIKDMKTPAAKERAKAVHRDLKARHAASKQVIGSTKISISKLKSKAALKKNQEAVKRIGRRIAANKNGGMKSAAKKTATLKAKKK